MSVDTLTISADTLTISVDTLTISADTLTISADTLTIDCINIFLLHAEAQRRRGAEAQRESLKLRLLQEV